LGDFFTNASGHPDFLSAENLILFCHVFDNVVQLFILPSTFHRPSPTQWPKKGLDLNPEIIFLAEIFFLSLNGRKIKIYGTAFSTGFDERQLLLHLLFPKKKRLTHESHSCRKKIGTNPTITDSSGVIAGLC
jgi:hypothetical protein